MLCATIPKRNSTCPSFQLDPANQKSIIEIQNEAALEHQAKPNPTGMAKALVSLSSVSGNSDDAMDVDDPDDDDDDGMVPMPQPGSIAVLKDRLHARIAALGRPGAQNNEPGDRDELLEERRKQRAALREKRRKDTRERIKAETEGKKDSGKAKEKVKDGDSKSRPVSTKVRPPRLLSEVHPTPLFRTNCS